MKRPVYVYMLSSKRNGTLYTGTTHDLIKRVYLHKNKLLPGFTSQYNLTQLVYYEVFDDSQEAQLRENRLKHWKRAWKIRLIEDFNPY